MIFFHINFIINLFKLLNDLNKNLILEKQENYFFYFLLLDNTKIKKITFFWGFFSDLLPAALIKLINCLGVSKLVE